MLLLQLVSWLLAICAPIYRPFVFVSRYASLGQQQPTYTLPVAEKYPILVDDSITTAPYRISYQDHFRGRFSTQIVFANPEISEPASTRQEVQATAKETGESKKRTENVPTRVFSTKIAGIARYE